MASIGGVTCWSVIGALPPDGRMQSERWHRAGINGEGVQLLGYGGVETELTAIYFGTKATVQTWANLITAMQGQVVTVINDYGDTQTRMFLQQIEDVKKTPAWRGAVTTRGEIGIKAVRV
jgi:hypothetical protein